MALNTLNVGSYKRVTASGNVKNSSGAMLGVFCASGTTPTLAIYDDAAAGTTVPLVDVFTMVPGTWYPLPFSFINGLNFVVTGAPSLTVSLV